MRAAPAPSPATPIRAARTRPEPAPRRRGPVKLREQAYESFTRNLLALRIRPGQFVSQRELVSLTGLPLGAIRELIPRLEADGLLTTVPQRGMQIANVDLKLVRNAFQLRAILEKEAIAHFTETVDDETIMAIAEAHASVLRRAKRGVTPALLEEAQTVDWRLHDTMIDSLGNEIITSIYRINSIKIRLIRIERVLLSPAVLMPAMEEHMAIIRAIQTRDPRQAVRALDRHMKSARKRAMGV